MMMMINIKHRQSSRNKKVKIEYNFILLKGQFDSLFLSDLTSTSSDE